MDVDGGSSDAGEIDQNLLLQFSCMNTSERDELINEMQKLLGPNLNYCTANFFLDMSNWNLQKAICSYLDYSTVPKYPRLGMSVKNGPTEIPTVPPCSFFEQSFTLENSGSDQWPGNCIVEQFQGVQLGTLTYDVPPLPPGHTVTVTMTLMAPENPGTYTGIFHLLDKRNPFGETMSVTVTVECAMTMALVEQLAALPVPSGRMEGPSNQTSQEDKMC